jgi:hypothetical protein
VASRHAGCPATQGRTLPVRSTRGGTRGQRSFFYGRIEALEQADLDNANLGKLCAYFESHESCETGM